MIASMEPRVVHVSEGDAARDLTAILERGQAGVEVVIERDAQPLAVIRAAAPARRTISEWIALAEAHEKETGNNAGARCRLSAPTWRRSSVTGSRGTRLRGVNPRYQRSDRQRHTVRQILEQFKTDCGEVEIGLSVVTIVELVHCVQRAGSEERRERRQAFVEELVRDLPVHPVTIDATSRSCPA